jgi:hypothetical protein
MTDQQLAALVELLATHTGLSRVTPDEISKALRLAEDRGYKITAPVNAG